MKTLMSFNPHTHTGCDRLFTLYSYIYGVSIHTPIQGVTLGSARSSDGTRCFNPHTHTGCDTQRVLGSSKIPCFNPHTHTGCDFHDAVSNHCEHSFNPHTHTGCDSLAQCGEVLKLVSIHTPIQGVTKRPFSRILHIVVSIHTPIQGVTKPPHPMRWSRKFQSTHPYRV